MKVTRSMEQSDAELVASTLNEKYPRLQIVSEKWPRAILEDWGFAEWENTRVCFLEVTFQPQFGTPKLKASLKGHVEIGELTIEFRDFDPSACSTGTACQKLLKLLTALAKDVLIRTRHKFYVDGSDVRAPIESIQFI